MPENSLKNLIEKLFKKSGVAEIPFQEIFDSFGVVGKVYDMGDGKTIIPELLTETEILLKLYMPKGSRYKLNFHNDADEDLFVITGRLRNDSFRRVQGMFGFFKWTAGTPHDLEAIEDTVAYALVTKLKD